MYWKYPFFKKYLIIELGISNLVLSKLKRFGIMPFKAIKETIEPVKSPWILKLNLSMATIRASMGKIPALKS